MSASGLRLRLSRPSPAAAGERLTLVLGSSAGTIEVKAQVVWVRSSAVAHDLGLEFVEPDSGVRAALFGLAWDGPDSMGPIASLGLGAHG